ncbi:mCG121677, isoform CRA_b, partial [Mus musculus]
VVRLGPSADLRGHPVAKNAQVHPRFSASWGRIWDPKASRGSRRAVWPCRRRPRADGGSGPRPPLQVSQYSVKPANQKKDCLSFEDVAVYFSWEE